MQLNAMRRVEAQHYRAKVRGVMLIEALVAVIVLAFGLLSLAGLQVVSMKNQQGSRYVQLAAESVLNITERTRTNPTGVRNGSYVYNVSYATAVVAVRTISGCVATADCTPDQIASNDITTWLNSAQTSFPGGAVNLASVDNGFVGTIMWLDKDNKDETAPTAATLVSAETCAAAMTSTRWRNCCPPAVAAPAGVRCLRNYFLP